MGVDGFGQQQYYVRLEKRGSGQWQIGDQVGGNYDRYQRANSAVPLDITLHWTIERSDINKNALTNAHGRLEYLAANLSNTKLYEYHNDADGKSGFASGELLSSPNDIFDAGCGG